ncbi:MFS transporter [Martelella sp. HB161492]|uniref:MFS transporter n=1 Tax=Martelella sp. HB161492 TaxID=2720726 RepID=UPI001590982C|nr:MFS transporter [Martelella sp. HB161492]
MGLSISSGRTRLIGSLAVGQLIGWGAGFDMLSVTARPMGEALGIAYDLLFGGLTLFMLVLAVAGPPVGRLVTRYGARPFLSAGAVVMALGLVLLAACHGPIGYFAAWGVIGLGGAFALSNPAYAAIVEREGRHARRAIGLMMIVTGMSAGFAWPLFSFVVENAGWRTALFVGAGLLLFIAAPLNFFGPGPRPARTAAQGRDAAQMPLLLPAREKRRAFVLIALFSTAFSIIGFGISPSLIELLGLAGAGPALALSLASMRSFLGISARAADLFIGRNDDPLPAAFLAGSLPLLGGVVAIVLAPSPAAAIAFVLLYGFGSGMGAVSRAVLPLGFFAPGEYALMAGRIALPQNLATAVAPLLFSLCLARLGFVVALVAVVMLALVALTAVWCLAGLRARSALRPGTQM